MNGLFDQLKEIEKTMTNPREIKPSFGMDRGERRVT